jgi:nicotinate phosphoribosyltransferase
MTTATLIPIRIPGPSMKTDRYELGMLSSFVEDGTVNHRAVFECFARRLPTGRRYGIVAGLGRLLPLIRDFRFHEAEVDWLLTEGVITAKTAVYLHYFRFTGTITAYPEGDAYFPNSPILTVAGTKGEGVILETLILSVLNHDSAIASAASRMTTAGAGRPMIEMGSRRTHEDAALAVARAAYIAGFTSTSNLAAGYVYGIPTVGTAAHAFTLAHRTEAEAFTSQVATHGAGTTLLVDTYDIAQGIRTAIEVAGTGLGAIRIDSGDLNDEARKARVLLDSLGATGTRITVTSDLDEYVLADLADAPINGYGVGTRVATGSGHPTAGMVYKLVAVADTPDGPLRPVAKKASGKASVGGQKVAYRTYADDGILTGEHFIVLDTDEPVSVPGTPVQVVVMRGGEIVDEQILDEARLHHAAAVATLPPEARLLTDGPAIFTATLSA